LYDLGVLESRLNSSESHQICPEACSNQDLHDCSFHDGVTAANLDLKALVRLHREKNQVLTNISAAVLLVKPPEKPVELALIDELAPIFGIKVQGDFTTPLSDFLSQLDPNKRLKATLVAQPTIDPKDSTKISWDVNSGIASNALWCSVNLDSYQAAIALSYTVTGADTLVNDALDWIASKFSDFKPNLKVKTPPVNITLTRLTTYPVQDTQTSAPTRLTTLSFSFDISAFHLYLDLSSVGREIVLTPRDGKSIAELVSDAFGDEQNIDMTLLPNPEGSDPFTSLFDKVHLWYIRILQDPTLPKRKQLQWGIGILAFWKPNGINIATSLTYDSQSQLFVGRLMFEQDFQDSIDVRLPTWDARFSPGPILVKEGLKPNDFGRSLDLWKLVGFNPNDQPPIPTKLQNVRSRGQSRSLGHGIRSF
jgi:hypothetical protein